MNKRQRKKKNYNEEKMWRIMRDYYKGRVCYNSTLKRLANIEKTLATLWQKRVDEEGDYRTGEESYGYSENNEDQFSYVSDRWNCAFRLSWILGLLQLKEKGE